MCDYNVIMKVDLVRIGNSRGIRIPKPLIEQCGLGDTVELSVEDGRIIVGPEDRPRRGWAAAFRKAGTSEADELLLEGAPNRFDREEWKW
jgi:antitoxin MazE